MRPTIIVWTIIIIIFIVISRVCGSKVNDCYDNPNRPYVAGCP